MFSKSFFALLLAAGTASAVALPGNPLTPKCTKTQVAILGAGVSGITAAQTLHNASISDFIIVEYNGEIGGRVAHTTFGKDSKGQPYTVELGANWVQGLGSEGGPENPIWTLAKKYGLKNTYSDYESILTFNGDGAANYTAKIDDFLEYYDKVEKDAGTMLTANAQDRSFRSGLLAEGWRPKWDMEKKAVEWWEFDWEYAYTPEQSSEEFSIINYNSTFYQYSDENNYVFDSRGFNTFITGEASTFLTANDPRLLLNTIVKNITYSPTGPGVTVYNTDGSCISADFAIMTFSVGVLQSDLITFSPSLPDWKVDGISSMQMGTYTKIFLQFDPKDQFWDADTQFFLYADPIERGYFPVWQSLSHPDFLPNSGIFFVTVVDEQSYRVEAQSEAETLAQVLEVLQKMYPKIKIPKPIAFMYPRWSREPWALGSYSNWPTGTSLAMHENLRANLGGLYFAGEAASPEYYGFLQGAYFEGIAAATTIAACIKKQSGCKDRPRYPNLKGQNPTSDMVSANGWSGATFETWGYTA